MAGQTAHPTKRSQEPNRSWGNKLSTNKDKKISKNTLHLNIITANTTCWTACRDWLGDLGAADLPHVLLLQEHKLAKDDDINDASTFAESLGYTSTWTRASRGPGGKPAGGTAILAAVQLGLTRPHLPKGIHPHPRTTIGIIEPPTFGKILVFSAYGNVNVGAKDDNLDMVASFPLIAEAMQMQYIAGGDFNIKANQLNKTGIMKKSGSTIMAPTRSTCITRSWNAGSTIEYFILTTGVHMLFNQPTVIDDAPLVPRFRHLLLPIKKDVRW